jgi:diaminopimelate decarboxylase
LIKQAQAMIGIDAPYGLSVRYAMKANPHPEILKTFKEQGLKIDASSSYEAELALANGYRPADILLTSQQLADNLKELVEQGVEFNATSLRQLEEYGKLFPRTTVSVRINPGIGSGHSLKTNVGGVTSSFGIWHEYIPKVHEIAERYNLRIIRLHTHIGAGTDPAIWHEAARISLELIKNFPDASIINLGGGFKVARTDEEHGIDAQEVGRAIASELKLFYGDTGRKLLLELEPGTFLVANAGILLCKVEDITDTGSEGYTFLKLDTGMNDILRPTLYGAQHPIAIMSDSRKLVEYVVVGHNCESGDLLTPALGNPEIISTRHLPESHIGDVVLIGGTGAYCASMAAHGYNSFPSARELVV